MEIEILSRKQIKEVVKLEVLKKVEYIESTLDNLRRKLLKLEEEIKILNDRKW